MLKTFLLLLNIFVKIVTQYHSKVWVDSFKKKKKFTLHSAREQGAVCDFCSVEGPHNPRLCKCLNL